MSDPVDAGKKPAKEEETYQVPKKYVDRLIAERLAAAQDDDDEEPHPARAPKEDKK